VYLGTESLLFAGNDKFQVITYVWTGRTKIYLFLLQKQTSRFHDVLIDNFPDLAGLIPFIVTKGNDVTAARKIGCDRSLRSMKNTSRTQTEIRLLSLII